MRYLLELRSATKVDTGVYRWSFSERNLFRPNTVTIGPCSVTAENDLRNVVLLSNTFRNSDMPHVNRSDSLKPVLTVIYPEMRSTHSPDASSGGGGSSNAELGSDAAIDAIDATGDLLCWVDLANTRVLDQSFQQATGAGFSNAYYIYNRSQNAMLTWTVGYGTGMTLANFPAAGTGTVGLTRTGSWESVLDSTPISTAQLQENFEFHSLFSVLGNSWSYLFDFHTMQILWWGQTLTYYDASGVKQSVPGLTVIPLQDYLLSVRREKLDAANTNFYWRLENLTAGGTVQTATTGSGLAVPPQAPLWRGMLPLILTTSSPVFLCAIAIPWTPIGATSSDSGFGTRTMGAHPPAAARGRARPQTNGISCSIPEKQPTRFSRPILETLCGL
jgi:hypothetical protein